MPHGEEFEFEKVKSLPLLKGGWWAGLISVYNYNYVAACNQF